MENILESPTENLKKHSIFITIKCGVCYKITLVDCKNFQNVILCAGKREKWAS